MERGSAIAHLLAIFILLCLAVIAICAFTRDLRHQVCDLRLSHAVSQADSATIYAETAPFYYPLKWECPRDTPSPGDGT